MSPTVLCAVMLTIALDYGYEEMPEGGLRYIIQIEPEMIETLQSGAPMGSAIPPEVRGRVREFQIVSNRVELSKVVPPLPEPPPEAVSVPAETTVPAEPVDQPPNTPIFPTELNWPPSPVTEAGPLPEPELFPDSRVVPASGIENRERPLDGPSGDLPPEEADVANSSKPGMWLLLVSVIAAGSSSGMLFFGWLAFDYRSRYLGLLRDSIATDTAWINGRADRVEAADPTAVDSSVDSENSDDASFGNEKNIVFEDSAWKDAGSASKDSLDDWLNEDNDGRR